MRKAFVTTIMKGRIQDQIRNTINASIFFIFRLTKTFTFNRFFQLLMGDQGFDKTYKKEERVDLNINWKYKTN